jgi:hypothetical protein
VLELGLGLGLLRERRKIASYHQNNSLIV